MATFMPCWLDRRGISTWTSPCERTTASDESSARRKSPATACRSSAATACRCAVGKSLDGRSAHCQFAHASLAGRLDATAARPETGGSLRNESAGVFQVESSPNNMRPITFLRLRWRDDSDPLNRMSDPHSPIGRADAFCRHFGLRVPILLAPMAGDCPTSLSAAVANAGGLGACGALLMQREAILSWTSELRAASNGRFQLNSWVPDPPPQRDATHEAVVRAFLAK